MSTRFVFAGLAAGLVADRASGGEWFEGRFAQQRCGPLRGPCCWETGGASTTPTPCAPAHHPNRRAPNPSIAPGGAVEMGMVVRLVHGDDVIADSREDGGFGGACAKFKE